MWRYLVGAVAALLLGAGGLLLWRGGADARQALPAPPAAVAGNDDSDPADPPSASAKTREEKRFGRYDKDKDGAITRDEYLLARRKAFAKLDKNADGKLDFEEYAVKTSERFGTADGDKSGRLDASEFATTKMVRKTPAKANCPPVKAADDGDG